MNSIRPIESIRLANRFESIIPSSTANVMSWPRIYTSISASSPCDVLRLGQSIAGHSAHLQAILTSNSFRGYVIRFLKFSTVQHIKSREVHDNKTG